MNAGLEKAIQEAMMELDWMTDDWLISLSALEKMTANEKTRTASTSLKSQLALKKEQKICRYLILLVICEKWPLIWQQVMIVYSVFSISQNLRQNMSCNHLQIKQNYMPFYIKVHFLSNGPLQIKVSVWVISLKVKT